MSKTKTRVFKFCISEKEYAALLRAAESDQECRTQNGKVNISKYVRKKILVFENNPEQIQKAVNHLIYQFRKIGTNINQVTRKINSDLGTPGDLLTLQTELEKLERITKQTNEILIQGLDQKQEKNNGSD